MEESNEGKAMSKQPELTYTFSNAARTEVIRIGRWDECGVFRAIASIPYRGLDFIDLDKKKAARLVARLSQTQAA